MLDLYSIYKTQGTLENLNIFLVGDLKYGRTVHSLLMAMRHFNPTFHFIAPEELKMPEEYKLYCKTHQIKYVEHTDFTEEIIADADILYMTRVQRERFTDLMEYERVKNVYILRNKMLENTRPNLRILHPLPVSTKLLTMWMTTRKHIISNRHKTVCMPAKQSFAMY